VSYVTLLTAAIPQMARAHARRLRLLGRRHAPPQPVYSHAPRALDVFLVPSAAKADGEWEDLYVQVRGYGWLLAAHVYFTGCSCVLVCWFVHTSVWFVHTYNHRSGIDWGSNANNFKWVDGIAANIATKRFDVDGDGVFTAPERRQALAEWRNDRYKTARMWEDKFGSVYRVKVSTRMREQSAPHPCVSRRRRRCERGCSAVNKVTTPRYGITLLRWPRTYEQRTTTVAMNKATTPPFVHTYVWHATAPFVHTCVAQHGEVPGEIGDAFETREEEEWAAKLVNNVMAQERFVDTVLRLGPAVMNDAFLNNAVVKYMNFLTLAETETNLVLPFDVDLIWQVHQCSPVDYKADVGELHESFVGWGGSDDADATTARTAALYLNKFDEPLSVPSIDEGGQVLFDHEGGFYEEGSDGDSVGSWGDKSMQSLSDDVWDDDLQKWVECEDEDE